MAPPVLHRVCHGSSTPSAFQKSLLTIRPALLPGYRRHKVRGCDYPAIMPSIGPFESSAGTGECVRGTCVTGLTDGDIWRLDIFEGDEYERVRVKVRILQEVGDEDGKGNVGAEEVEVETYVWVAGRERLEEEEEWDFAEFLREKMGRWVGGAELEGVLRPSILGAWSGIGV